MLWNQGHGKEEVTLTQVCTELWLFLYMNATAVAKAIHVTVWWNCVGYQWSLPLKVYCYKLHSNDSCFYNCMEIVLQHHRLAVVIYWGFATAIEISFCNSRISLRYHIHFWCNNWTASIGINGNMVQKHLFLTWQKFFYLGHVRMSSVLCYTLWTGRHILKS